MRTANDPRAQYARLHRDTSADIPDAVYRSVAEDYVAEFARLVRQWRHATSALSLVSQKTDHPAFRGIVGMGELATPLIILELRKRPDFLFLALKEIVGVDQLPAGNARDPRSRVDAWLRWAERQGHAD